MTEKMPERIWVSNDQTNCYWSFCKQMDTTAYVRADHPPSSQKKAALESMPDFVGTPDTSAYKRSMLKVAKWYCTHYATIRQALQEPTVDLGRVRDILKRTEKYIDKGDCDPEGVFSEHIKDALAILSSSAKEGE